MGWWFGLLHGLVIVMGLLHGLVLVLVVGLLHWLVVVMVVGVITWVGGGDCGLCYYMGWWL